MKIELRADGAHISGYVNVTEKKSKPIITPRGKVVEEVEPRAFEAALERAGNITVTVDHNNTHVYACTDDGTLEMYEDNIGLHANVLIVDPDLIELAKKGKIRGWSFGMYNIQDTVEQRADDYPLRKIKSLDLDHLSLLVGSNPAYMATSVEVRAESEIDLEIRSIDVPVQVETLEPEKPKFDNSAYRARAEAIKNHTNGGKKR